MVRRRRSAHHGIEGHTREVERAVPPAPPVSGPLPPLRRWPVVVAAMAVGGCELAETTVPLGEPVVVVHAVMRPDLPDLMGGQQYVVVERTFRGDADRIQDPLTGDSVFRIGENVTIPYGGVPPLPIEGATVTVKNLDALNDPCGGSVAFVETRPPPLLSRRAGVYWSPFGCPVVRPGDRLELSVETPDGERVLGRTTVPGLDEVRVTVGGATRVFRPDSVTVFNRDRDTLLFDVVATVGRLVQLEVRRRSELSDFGTKIFVDTTAFRLPADIINTFVVGNEDDVFRAGREYAVTIAVTDTNYYDFARSENNLYTGRGFINHLRGGIGVFGSMAARTTVFRARGEIDEPREGRYRLTGRLALTERDSVDVDLTWEIYLHRPRPSSEFSAFVSGAWLYGPIDTSVDGVFDGDRLTAAIVDTTGVVVQHDTLRGRWLPDAPFSVQVLRGCSRDAPAGGCSTQARTRGIATLAKQ